MRISDWNSDVCSSVLLGDGRYRRVQPRDRRRGDVSVAFRRESYDELKEPRFELPLPAGPNIVTPRGLRLIRDQVQRIEQALAADPAEPESRQRELRYWNTRAATAELAPAPPEGEVAIGTRVR